MIFLSKDEAQKPQGIFPVPLQSLALIQQVMWWLKLFSFTAKGDDKNHEKVFLSVN